MIPISTHLHAKPYQVATTTDTSLPFRKWDHRGTFWAPSHRSAAYDAVDGHGDIVGGKLGEHGSYYRFASGLWVCVHL